MINAIHGGLMRFLSSMRAAALECLWLTAQEYSYIIGKTKCTFFQNEKYIF